MAKKIAHACGCGFGTCLKLYALFAIPQIWFWFPAVVIEEFIKGE